MLIGTEEMHNLYNACHQSGSSYDVELHLKQKLEFLIVILFIWKTVLEVGLILIMAYE